MSIRPVKRIIQSKPTIEGAGVKLRRAFGFGETSEFDPFLLLDDFRSDDPDQYRNGFPWHPHRGMETITYVLRGEVAHGDNMGNRDSIRAGDVAPPWLRLGESAATRAAKAPPAWRGEVTLALIPGFTRGRLSTGTAAST